MERTLGASWSFCRMKNKNYGGVVLRIPSPPPHLLLSPSLSLSLSRSLSLSLSFFSLPSYPQQLLKNEFVLLINLHRLCTADINFLLRLSKCGVLKFRNSCNVLFVSVLAPNLPLSSSTLHYAAQTGLSFSVSPRPSNIAPLPLHGFCSGAASMFLVPRRLMLAPPAFVLRQA